jgi:hypothetical protein
MKDGKMDEGKREFDLEERTIDFAIRIVRTAESLQCLRQASERREKTRGGTFNSTFYIRLV